MKSLLSCGVLLALCWPGQASTLQYLSLDDMIQKSTAIVRGTVEQAQSAVHGSVIYTHFRVHVSEVWKGPVAGQLDIVVPGGSVNGLRETYSGAPSLVNGREYILYLWTSKSGLTHVMGLSQGLFDVRPNASGQQMATRAATTERMVDNAGQDFSDSNFQMPVSDMRMRVQRAAGSAHGK